MIVLTGDIHHNSLECEEKAWFSQTPAKSGLYYLQIARDYNLKVTFFITGKVAKEEPKTLIKMLEFGNLEIGGHTYDALRFNFGGIAKIIKRATRRSYNIGYFQKKDIEKTVKAIKTVTQKEIKIWRTHSYASDASTINILEKKGFNIISDERNSLALYPYRIGGKRLISLPINVMPDHEHLYHGARNANHVKYLNWKGDCFGKESYTAEKWLDIVMKQVENIQAKGGIATLLVHPQCMDVLDRFKTFEKLCQYLSQYKSLFVSETLPYAKDSPY
ncbi:MAG: hypothetical protein B5M53_01130 [Candidatus Cloacimonas sp. 4484_209]|nr:MAG: hypothetical protein B5M53_01130 [Candidatus Cloacimonas sp. 4484_209]